jgi:2-C-methyl-D-erythritol 2,4-cyclodiphosphate synthase
MKFRIGLGIDVHQLSKDRDLFLGGIKIASEKGCIAHSDGDVLLHAICDALLGAANLRDIGFHFPDNSDEFKNIDSKILLSRTCNLLYSKGYKIENIDSTVCLEKPKIKDYIPEMIKTIAKVINISEDCISIKATTTEKLGFTGREEGVVALAVVSISKE